jgi:mannan endo-1,4-beta-mannosidase
MQHLPDNPTSRWRRPNKAPPWIGIAPNAPYFTTDNGAAWTPIGQNDSISWLELQGLFRRRNLPQAEAYLDRLTASGVTVLRLMLECAQGRSRYIERPVGVFVPAMVRLWDDLFAMCERRGLRILLTPFDTFWTWLRWRHHPYSTNKGGHLETPARMLLCKHTREAIKARLSFAVRRWGGSGTLFAWDLWNEIHPAQAEDSVDCWDAFIADLSQHVRRLEMQLYGRTHLQTVSLFGPELDWRPHLAMKAPIFSHPDLDFATIHIYMKGTIDDPRNTVAPAVDMGRIVRRSLSDITDGRPFLDTEHGPIHSFKDRHITLPEPFDDENFRHMQWAHFASGGAGGGMRWPNRHPHRLTDGMRRAQKNLADFVGLIGWTSFRRVNLNEEVRVSVPRACVFGCGDGAQALVWLLRRDTLSKAGTLDRKASPIAPQVTVPGLAPGRYRITAWDTLKGTLGEPFAAEATDRTGLTFQAPPFTADLAFAITPSGSERES